MGCVAGGSGVRLAQRGTSRDASVTLLRLCLWLSHFGCLSPSAVTVTFSFFLEDGRDVSEGALGEEVKLQVKPAWPAGRLGELSLDGFWVVHYFLRMSQKRSQPAARANKMYPVY